MTAKVAVKQTHPDWEAGYVPGNENVDYAAYVNHPLNNGYAIPTTSENPERALMFYQKMVMDKTYNQLAQYGIEGTDYTVKDGVYQQVGDGFSYEGMNGWSWRNPDFMLKNDHRAAGFCETKRSSRRIRHYQKINLCRKCRSRKFLSS